MRTRAWQRKRIAVFFMTAFFMSLCSMSSGAMAQSCPRGSGKAVLKSYETKTRLIRSKSADDLTRWQTGHSSRGAHILGLGGGEIGTKIQAEFEVKELDNGQFCLSLKKVIAKFYTKPQIHIASNFKKGTCEYKEVLRHEKKHILTLKKFHREYTPKYRAELKRIIRKVPVQRPTTENGLEGQQQQIMQMVQKHMSAYTEKIMAVLSGRQKRIDSPQEYKLVASRCRNWDKKLANN